MAFLSPYFICLLFLVLVWSVGAELYVLREGGHSLAKQLKARRLVLMKVLLKKILL